ncbi:MAG: proteophosphoglycan precursor [Rhodospirillaceae bacterium]|nr:proteophosphoglycan precursor [Rhodospirillaceae bacterium]|tara:strand:- start:130 stop:714 length:585 start_codon:yes stop_codon:yes gene_type:complete
MSENTPDLSSFIGDAAPGGEAPAPVGIALRPRQTLCGDIDMRIGLDGTWYYASSPIGRKELVKLFSTVLHRDDAGDHWLITPAEVCRIQVDDAPYLAVEATVEGSGKDQKITLRTNIDQTVAIGADHPLRVEVDPETLEPRPYVGLERGLEARLTRSVYYQLVELAVEETVEGANIYGIWSEGRFFSIGRLEQE